MRAHQRFLGHPPDTRPTGDHLPLAQVTFTRAALRALHEQLYVPGRLRAGLLFGEQTGDTLHVHLATPPLYPHWHADPVQALLQPDERYALGWSDCVAAMHGPQIDWTGSWLAYPSSELGELQADLGWVDLMAAHGLVDAQHALLTVGWNEGVFAVRGFTQDHHRQWQELACHTAPQRPPQRIN